MLLAVFTYFLGLRKRWFALQNVNKADKAPLTPGDQA